MATSKRKAKSTAVKKNNRKATSKSKSRTSGT